jgi:uncharacterized RDD family membrane protein YckC
VNDSALNSSHTSPSDQAWKEEANRRLAAHRARRGGRALLQAALPGMEESGVNERISGSRGKSVADRVAARYAQAPTYSEMLAAEARNAARAATAAAVAAGEARDAAQAILVGLDVDIREGLEEQARYDFEEHLRGPRSAPVRIPPFQSQVVQSQVPQRAVEQTARHSGPAIVEAADEDLDEAEIQAPIQPLPAKLLEFPRELVATRKARPRLAEGPLRTEAEGDVTKSQIRIFEVETEDISTEPVVEPMMAGWSAIRLDTAPEVHRASSMYSSGAVADRQAAGLGRHSGDSVKARPQHNTPAAGFDLPMQTASLEDRLMAGIVDVALVTAAFLVFVFVFAACTVHPPTGEPAQVGAAVAFFAFAAIYQILFFNFGCDTPGMRYAKIALCTFDDENPTRQMIRRRLAALLLSAGPLGLGILWAFFDDDRLGWHDRISKTYQRSYR